MILQSGVIIFSLGKRQSSSRFTEFQRALSRTAPFSRLRLKMLTKLSLLVAVSSCTLEIILFHLPLQTFWEVILGNLTLKKYLLRKIWDDGILSSLFYANSPILWKRGLARLSKKTLYCKFSFHHRNHLHNACYPLALHFYQLASEFIDGGLAPA